MLGSLFDGDEEFYGNVGNSVSYKYRNSEEYSVSGRQESGFVGGATCYLNSLVQSMFMTPEMRYSLFQLNYETESKNQTAVEEKATIDYQKEPYFDQLLEYGFSPPLICKCFDKFYTNKMDERIKENMLQWIFEQPPLDEEDVKKYTTTRTETIKSKPKRIPIPRVLQRMFAFMSSVDRPAISTQQLTESFGWESKHVVVQHDVQELNRVLFQALENSLKNTSERDLIKSLYRGTMVNSITCQQCFKVSAREEEFDDVPLVVSDSLQQSLESYCEIEVMKDNNAYSCDSCGKVTAHRCTKFRTLPPILHFSLLRFAYDNVEGRKKILTEMQFPIADALDMSQYMENTSDALYELFAVIIHLGSPYSGHYHVVVRDTLHEGKHEPPTEDKANEDGIRWFDFNDEQVLPVTSHDIKKYFGKSESAYMLVYRRRDSTSATPVSVPHYLIDEIEKENERVKVRREEIKREKELEELRNTVKQMHVHVYLPSAFEIVENGHLQLLSEEKKRSHKYITIDDGVSVEAFKDLLREKFQQVEGDFEVYALVSESKSDQTYSVNEPLAADAEEQLEQLISKTKITNDSSLLIYPLHQPIPFHIEDIHTCNIIVHHVDSGAATPLQLDITNEQMTLPLDGRIFHGQVEITGPRNIVLFANSNLYVANSADEVREYKTKLESEIVIYAKNTILKFPDTVEWDEVYSTLASLYEMEDFIVEKNVAGEFIEVNSVADLISGDTVRCTERKSERPSMDWTFTELIYPNALEANDNFIRGEQYTITLEHSLTVKLCKQFLSQSQKHRNSLYTNSYDFRIRFSRANGEPASIMFTEDDKTMGDTFQKQIDCEFDPGCLFIELNQPPLDGLIRLHVNLLVNWPPSNPNKISEKGDHLIPIANINASSHWTLELLRKRMQEQLSCFSQVEKPQLLRFRDCSRDCGYLRPTRTYTNRFHLHKTLDKLHWNNDKHLAIQIIMEETEEDTKTNVPPPVLLSIRRLRGTYSAGIELPFPQKDQKLWTDISHFKQCVANATGDRSDIRIAKYNPRTEDLYEIEDPIPDEEGENKKKKQGASTISKRYNLQDGDILIVTDADLDEQVKNIWRTVEYQKQQELEQKRARKYGKDTDIEMYHIVHETEQPLQIFEM